MSNIAQVMRESPQAQAKYAWFQRNLNPVRLLRSHLLEFSSSPPSLLARTAQLKWLARARISLFLFGGHAHDEDAY